MIWLAAYLIVASTIVILISPLYERENPAPIIIGLAWPLIFVLVTIALLIVLAFGIDEEFFNDQF